MTKTTIVLLWLFLVGSGTAAAQQPPESAHDVARGHYTMGLRHYDLGLYEQAIREFELAYQGEPDPQILFAMAQAERKRGNCARAVDVYKAYLRSGPGERQVETTHELILRCQQQLEVVAVKPVEAPPPPPKRARAVWTWVGLGLTGAALVAASGLEIAGKLRYDELAGSCAPPQGPGCAPGDVHALSTQLTAGTALFITAGALGALTIIAAIVEHRPARAR